MSLQELDRPDGLGLPREIADPFVDPFADRLPARRRSETVPSAPPNATQAAQGERAPAGVATGARAPATGREPAQPARGRR